MNSNTLSLRVEKLYKSFISAGLKDIRHELFMLAILTVMYFSVGVYFFRKRHLLLV